MRRRSARSAIARPARSATAAASRSPSSRWYARDARLADQPLEQVAAEARRVIDRQADVLVEMKHLDARPVDARRGGERVEKLELRRAGRGDDPGLLPCVNRRTKGLRGVPRRRQAHRRPIDVGFDLHISASRVGAVRATAPTFGGIAANVFSMLSSTASVDRTPAWR